MIKFAIRKRFELKPDVTEETLVAVFRNRIDKTFTRKKFSVESDKIIFEGELPSFWENCHITAQIRLNIEDGHIFCCQVEGELSPNIMQGCGCWGIGIVLIVALLFLSWPLIIGGFLGVVMIPLFEFACSCRRPERYFDEIIEAIQFKYGLSSAK